MKTAIIGAGAMGSLMGARLAEAGIDVTLVDTDEAHVRAIQQSGLWFEDDVGARFIPIAARLPSDIDGAFDLMIFFTKSFHTPKAARAAAAWTSPSTWALTLQNGLGGAERLAGVAAAERIAIGTTNLPSDKLGPGRVRSHGEGSIWLGAWQGVPGEGLARIAALLASAGLDCKIDPAIQTRIWEKVAFNCAMNTLAAITDRPVGGLADSLPLRTLALRVAEEVGAVCRAGGTPFDQERVIATIEHAYLHHRSHLPSMLQDLRAGRGTEVGALNGAVAELAQARGVAAPVVQTLGALVEALEPKATP